MSCVLRCNGARFDVVVLAPEVLHAVAAEWHTALSQQTQFLKWRPRSRAAVRAWRRALDYALTTLASTDTAQQPMIAAAMANLLAGALLECYPSNLTEQDPAGDAALPETLKEAVSFIHRHTTEDIGINDVAAAVHLTPRAVQYLFRRQLDTTPTEYMRRIRLRRAHLELIAATAGTSTVTEIAQRWGSRTPDGSRCSTATPTGKAPTPRCANRPRVRAAVNRSTGAAAGSRRSGH